jgi:hypothetical protein
VEDSLTEYARKHPKPESAAAFLRRVRAMTPADDQAVAELEAAIEEHRQPHHGIDL